MITKPTKYTEEFVKNELRLILDYILDNKDIVYLGEVFEEKPYPRQCYSEWANKFKDVVEISDTIKRIDDILESRVNIGGLKQKLNPTMVIFNLKNNYKWKDKTETDLTSDGKPIFQIINYGAENNNNPVQLPTENLPITISEKPSEIQNSGTPQESGQIKDSTQPTDTEKSA